LFIGFVPYLIAQHRLFPSKWTALAPTLAFGLWLWPFLYRIFDFEGSPFWLHHMGLLVAIFTFFTSSERKFHEITGFRWFILHGLAASVGFEMIRSFIPFLGTMGFMANPLAGQAWLTQPVSIFSIYGLNLLVVLVNFALAQLIMNWMDEKWPQEDTVPVDGKSTRSWAIRTAVILAAWIGLSLVIYNQQPKGTETVRVAALHMDLKGPGHQADDTEQAARIDLLTEQMHEANAEGVELAFVPEMAFGFDPQERYTDELKALVEETDIYLYFSYVYDGDDGFHNETVLISPSGEFSPIYGKQHAFGEPPTVTAGSFPIHDTPFGKLGSIICMDGVFTDSARETAARGAQLLGNPSYDSTVGISEQNWTHFTMRAVENQIPVVNADRGYYSMITDSHGKILADARTPEGGSEVVIADVTLGEEGNTIYTRLGQDWLGYLSLAGFIFFMIYPSLVERRVKKGTE
jgi:apolipoprotein N-acyltransferase